ncbi:MAG: glycosyltransferase [Calditerrivibrio sp.]|nr:glycosyltransferase [Calditerrivibrio sp.]
MMVVFGNLKSPLIRERVKMLKEIAQKKVVIINDISDEKIEFYEGMKVYNQFSTKYKLLNYIVNFFITMFILLIVKPEIIIVHWGSRILQSLAISFWGRRVIVHTMGGDIDTNQDAKGYKKIFTNILLKKSRIITVKSNEMEKMLLNNFPKVKRSKIEILSWGVSESFIRSSYDFKKEEIPTFFCIRSCQPLYEKEIILYAINIFKNFYNIDIKLIVSLHRKVESYYLFLKKFVREFGLENNVEWVDVRYEDMPMYIKKSWAVISACRFDGFSQSLMEALAIGTWPIYRKSSAHINYLEVYKNVLFFETVEELVQSMIWIINNKSIRPVLNEDVIKLLDYNYQKKKYDDIIKKFY